MVGDLTGGQPHPMGIPLSAAFLSEKIISPERRSAVVSRVLNEFSKLSIGARNTLRSAVNDEIIPTTGGFRRGQAGRALERSSFLLQDPVVQAVSTSDLLAGTVLQCWAESHPSLREAVERHLTGRGLTTPGPNLPEKEFRGYWLVDQWEVERESFAQTYGDDFVQDDVALMLCYVSGNFPMAPDQGVKGVGEGTLSGTLSEALSCLRDLSATAPEWERQIPDFVASVSRLIEEKAAQLRWSEEFDAILLALRDTHADLFGFFEHDTEHWIASRVSAEADTTAALRLAGRLQSQLAEYQPIHERAPSISEERERVQMRETLQPSILATLKEIAALMTEEMGEQAEIWRGPDTVEPPAAPDDSTVPHTPASENPSTVSTQVAEPTVLGPEPPQSSKIPAVQEGRTSAGYSSSEASTTIAEPPGIAERPSGAANELSVLQSENVGLRDNTSALRSENQDLKDEVEVLKTELFGSQEREDSWRLAYRSAMDGSLEDVGVSPPVVESVYDAVEMAKGRFRQEMVFAPNSESSIEDNPFTDPVRVWEALQWLGTSYYASRMGRLRVTDFDQSIKEACGWWYKGDQGETTVSKFGKSYTTRVDGKRYTLVEHIGKGTTFDARYTIRIAFDWDRDKRQVIVGYIGRHQQTDAS